jgi:hypothetical protein
MKGCNMLILNTQDHNKKKENDLFWEARHFELLMSSPMNTPCWRRKVCISKFSSQELLPIAVWDCAGGPLLIGAVAKEQ